MRASFAASLLGFVILFAAPVAQAMPAAAAGPQDQATFGAQIVLADHKREQFRNRDLRRWERRAERHSRRLQYRDDRHRGDRNRGNRHWEFKHRGDRQRDFHHRDFAYRDQRGRSYHHRHRNGRGNRDDDALYIIGGVLGVAAILGLITGY